ncbi:hypothetical protein JQ506_06290 [Shinella sp. PSBB067]|uniref:hypothetical protein n=1 Tax=unclassified Shinella TaxID=2643062 RepID=UPI00092881C5|nr:MULTISPECIES: hypothetical protein [unclassified Shinella]MBN9055682.1 hypothetical protein [Hyphomicrobiales bacterium]OJU99939.1 MAG: hypothetical protein BGO06_25385 [Shinella sp. 65-6]QRI64604.1 hypothetical protein JQ506_06290 [Shinella sp. PSBB067]
MPTAKKQPAQTGAAAETLQARYKPLGLRAVVAATQCKPEVKCTDPRRERDLPPVLQSLYE